MKYLFFFLFCCFSISVLHAQSNTILINFPGEIPPVTSSPCFAGSYYRKALSSQDYWLGFTGTVILPSIKFDPARINPANTAQYLDNPSVYIGGTANGQETDIGMTWEVIKDANGIVSADRRAFRPFMRRTAYQSTATDYSNAPADAAYYWYPGDTITMSVKVIIDGFVHFTVSGGGKSFETDYPADGYLTTSMMQFKRVNAIDQVNNEGNPVQPTRTQVLGSQWLSCYLYRNYNENIVQAPMHTGRFTDMRCPDLVFFNINATPDEYAVGGEHIDIDGTGGIPGDDIEMKELWNYTETSGILPNPDWTFANTNGRDITTDGKYVYVPIRDGALGTGVRVVDANTGQFVKMLSMNGISGQGNPFDINSIDITTDGKLLVGNLTVNAGAIPFKIYVYDLTNLDADPVTLLSFSGTTTSGTASARFGDKFSYVGSFADGKIMAVSNGISGKYFTWDVQNGIVVHTEPTVVNLYQSDGITPYTTSFGNYPSVRIAGADSVWIKGTSSRPSLFVNNNYVATIGFANKSNVSGNTAEPFTFQGKNYLLLVDYDSENSMAFGNMLEVTKDVSNAVSVSRTPNSFGPTENVNGTDGAAVAVYPDGLKLFFLCSSEGIAAYTIGTTDTETGINNLPKSEPLFVYPNPAHNILYFSEPMKETILYSISGQIIKQIFNCSQMIVSGLSGIYVIEAVDQFENIRRTKLIIR